MSDGPDTRTEAGPVPFRSLRRSIALNVTLISAIGTIGLLLAIGLSFALRIEYLKARYAEVSANATGAFDRFFLAARSDLLAGADGLADFPDGNRALLGILIRNPSFMSVLYADREGRPLAARVLPGAPPLTAENLGGSPSTMPGFRELSVSAVQFAHSVPYIDLAVEATDGLGRPRGKLIARLDLSSLWDATISLRVGERGSVNIMDGSGRIVISRNQRFLDLGRNWSEGRLLRAATAPARDPGFVYRNVEGRFVLATLRPLATMAWFALVEEPLGEALAPLAVPVLILLAVLVGGILLLGGTNRWAVRSVIEPLGHLQRSIARVTSGRYDERIEVGQNNEIGQIAGSFNLMSAKLLDAFRQLAERIASLHEADQSIKLSLREKEGLIQELYHRTGNNMQVIASMLSMQAHMEVEPRVVAIFDDMDTRIHAMALAQASLYETRDLSTVNMRNYVADLVSLLAASHDACRDRVELAASVGEVSVLIDTALPCGLILTELLSNAFRHAFPGQRRGRIEVALQRLEEGELELRVADDGIGLPGGLDPRIGGRLGFMNIFGLAETQLRGQVLLDMDGGLSCRIRFRDTLYSPRV